MGDEQKLPTDQLIRRAREAFENAQDLTLAVEEEFAILDPETLSLTNRFEDLQAAAQGTELQEHLVGELIASEVEVRTGRCETFAEVAARIPERRQQLAALADAQGVALAATGTHPWSPWQEQRIIDTPHYRRNDEILRYVVWRNHSFGQHLHVAIRGADRVVKVCDGLRPFLPELLAYSAALVLGQNVEREFCQVLVVREGQRYVHRSDDFMTQLGHEDDLPFVGIFQFKELLKRGIGEVVTAPRLHTDSPSHLDGGQEVCSISCFQRIRNPQLLYPYVMCHKGDHPAVSATRLQIRRA